MDTVLLYIVGIDPIPVVVEPVQFYIRVQSHGILNYKNVMECHGNEAYKLPVLYIWLWCHN